jgi:crossover junction endodeoxyribonuclease RusA
VTLTISLSYPPSVNANYRAVAGRTILSKKYREWKRTAGLEIMAQRAKPVHGPVAIDIALKAPDKRRRDIDNPLKALIDALKENLIIDADDNTVLRSISARWVETGEPCVVTIAEAA